MKKNLLIMLVVLGLGFQAATALDKKTQGFFVFFINGIDNTKPEALNGAQALQNASQIQSNMLGGDLLKPGDGKSFGLLYNAEPPIFPLTWFRQLIDTLKQKTAEGKEMEMQDFLQAYYQFGTSEFPYPLTFEPGTPQYNDDVKHLKDYYCKNYGSGGGTDYPDFCDKVFRGNNFKSLLDQYHDAIKDLPQFKYLREFLADYTTPEVKPFVLFIGHSQGTEYANMLFDYLTNKTPGEGENYPATHLGIFNIANIASTAATQAHVGIKPYAVRTPQAEDSWTYVTGKNDHVVNTLNYYETHVGTSYPDRQAALGNVTLYEEKPHCPDTFCHSLVETYLTDPFAGPVIARQINLFVLGLFQEYKKERLLMADPNYSIKFTYDPVTTVRPNTYQLRWNSTLNPLAPNTINDYVLCRTQLEECDDTGVGYLLTPVITDDIPKILARTVIFQYARPLAGTYYILSETNNHQDAAVGNLSVGSNLVVENSLIVNNNGIASSRKWFQDGNYFSAFFGGLPLDGDYSQAPRYKSMYYVEFRDGLKPSCPVVQSGKATACYILDAFTFQY